MADKVYVKIDGVTGPLNVDSFKGYFEAHYADGGAIVNSFSAGNNGMAYGGVPSVSNLRASLKNCDADVSSLLHQFVLKAQPLAEVKVSQVSRLNGKDTETHGITYTKAHIIAYHYDPSSRDIQLEIGNFSSIETAHYKLDVDGKPKPSRVKYDLAEVKVS